MKSHLLLIVAIVSATISSGCALNQVSSDHTTGTQQQLIDSEKTGQVDREWRRGGWMTESPAELTPYRIHGGVTPASSSI